MKNQPIYTTKACRAMQPETKPKRRRIGQMSDALKKELNNMSTFDRARVGIAAGMAMVTLLNR